VKTSHSFEALPVILKRGTYLLAVAACVCSCFAQESLPPGWRKPTSTEATGAWREKSPTRFLVAEGDFDGDGKKDTAELLVDLPGSHFNLFVKFAAVAEWQPLYGSVGEAKDLAEFGIVPVKPGQYKTACGKGYGDYACAHGEPELLQLSGSAIDFFFNESSDFIFYWDSKTKKFVKIQMSD
jgi:hypothetical protein